MGSTLRLTDWLTVSRNVTLLDKPIFSLEKMLHTGYDCKNAVEKMSSSESHGVWHQDELIGGKPPVVE
jgi:hypothetical protein